MYKTSANKAAPGIGIISKNYFEVIIVILVLSVTFYVALSPANNLLNWFSNDDSFFYFLVARNIVAGNGVTFDGINQTNGFHPLWMLFCLPVFAIFPEGIWLPLRAIVILFGIFQSASLILIFRMLRKHLPGYLSAVMALGFGLGSFVYDSIFSGGLESALNFFMILLLIFWGQKYLDSQKNTHLLFWIGVIAGLVLLCRLDNIFLIAFMGIWLIFDKVEDAAGFLADIIAAALIVTASFVIRLGFNLFPYERTIIVTIILFAGLGSLANFANGFYSSHSFTMKKNQIRRILINHVLFALAIAAITWFLFHHGFIETWSRSVFLYANAGWLLYVLLKWRITRRKHPNYLTSQDHFKPLPQLIFGWIAKPLAYFLPICVLLGCYFLWSQINFNTPMPVSGQIKAWWGTLGNTVYGAPIRTTQELKSFLFGHGTPFSFLYNTFSPAFSFLKLSTFQNDIICWGSILVLFLILISFKQRRHVIEWLTHLAILPISTGILMRIIFFYLTGYVHFRKWYWGVETLSIFFLFTAIIGSLWMIKSRSPILQKFIELAASIVMILVIGTFIQSISSTYSRSSDQNTLHEYLTVTREIEKATEEGAVIGIPGGGAISYFIRNRTIVNLDGLMNSKSYFDNLKKMDTYEFMQNMGIRYIYANEYMAEESLPYSKIFENHITCITMINNCNLYLYE